MVEGTGEREGAHRGVGGGGNWGKRRCTSRCWWWRELGKEKVHIEVLVVEGTRKEKAPTTNTSMCTFSLRSSLHHQHLDVHLLFPQFPPPPTPRCAPSLYAVPSTANTSMCTFSLRSSLHHQHLDVHLLFASSLHHQHLDVHLLFAQLPPPPTPRCAPSLSPVPSTTNTSMCTFYFPSSLHHQHLDVHHLFPQLPPPPTP